MREFRCYAALISSWTALNRSVWRDGLRLQRVETYHAYVVAVQKVLAAVAAVKTLVDLVLVTALLIGETLVADAAFAPPVARGVHVLA